MSDLGQRVQRVLDELVADGVERGVQVAVVHRGELVVDAVAGVADPATGRPVRPDTPFFSFSTGKAPAATVAHLLVADGLLGYDTALVESWPEFAAHGKADATLRHVLTHAVGLPALPPEVTPAGLGDPAGVGALLAAAEPWWPPGTATGYHSYTFGFLVGELARRLTGLPMSALLRDRIATPLGLAGELYFGVPEAELPGLARLEDAEPVDPRQESPVPGIAAWQLRPAASFGNDPAVLTADVPSVGTVTARGIAGLYAALLDGRLLGADSLNAMSTTAFEGTDRLFGNPARLALGFPLGRIGAAPEEPPTAFGWPGGGGSYAYADPRTGTAFALTKNRLAPSFATAQRLADLVTAALG